jgi:phenylacetate-coenzyme A ligase PaaK-like adenylate-forming protein
MDQLRARRKAGSTGSFSARDLRALRAKARRRPNDFAQTVPLMTLEELVSAKIASGDPYSLRWKKKAPPQIAFQLEYDTEAALYAGFEPNALNAYADALRRCWSLFGIGRGDRVAIFDYGTSPVSYLASRSFTPYLRRGAADILGCLPVCNDGAANLSQRAVDIVRFVRPRVLFLRADCLHPFAAEIANGSVALASYLDALVVVENEAVVTAAARDSYQAQFGVPVYRLLRADAAMFLAPECARCGLFHIWSDLYHVEILAPDGEDRKGRLVITNWFAASFRAIRYLSQVEAVLEPRGCPAGAKDLRIRA